MLLQSKQIRKAKPTKAKSGCKPARYHWKTKESSKLQAKSNQTVDEDTMQLSGNHQHITN